LISSFLHANAGLLASDILRIVFTSAWNNYNSEISFDVPKGTQQLKRDCNQGSVVYLGMKETKRICT